MATTNNRFEIIINASWFDPIYLVHDNRHYHMCKIEILISKFQNTIVKIGVQFTL